MLLIELIDNLFEVQIKQVRSDWHFQCIERVFQRIVGVYVQNPPCSISVFLEIVGGDQHQLEPSSGVQSVYACGWRGQQLKAKVCLYGRDLRSEKMDALCESCGTCRVPARIRYSLLLSLARSAKSRW